MPTLNLFTNVPVDAVVSSDILKDATKAVAKIIGKPESVKFPSTLPHINEMHRDTDTGFCFSLFSWVFVIAGFVFTLMTVNCLIILLSKITAFFWHWTTILCRTPRGNRLIIQPWHIFFGSPYWVFLVYCLLIKLKICVWENICYHASRKCIYNYIYIWIETPALPFLVLTGAFDCRSCVHCNDCHLFDIFNLKYFFLLFFPFAGLL